MRHAYLAAVSVAALLISGGAHAQSAATTTAAEEPTGLADIIVTAQRREESLQRAAVPVDVVKGSDLLKSGVTDVTTLGTMSPALTIEPSSTGNLLFIRGVGNFTLVPTSDPAVAFNYDNVYIGRPTSTSGTFFDLDRVEVLKGPQGTLYGRNATGGAINILPKQPELGKWGGYATGSYASYKDIYAEAAVNAPLGDRGAVRISGAIKSRDGYFDDGTSDDKSKALRAQIKGELTDNLTIRWAADYEDQGGVGQGVTYFGRYQFAGAAGYVFVPANLPRSEGVYTAAAQAFRQTGSAGPAGRRPELLAPYPFRDNRFFGSNADVSLKTEAGTLTIIPAYRYSKLRYISDAAAFIATNTEKDDQFSIEARFAGTRIGIFDYTLGAYYFDEQIDARQGIFASAIASILTQKLGTRSFAPFGRLTANISDELRVVGGVRYTRDRKTFNSIGASGTIVCQINTPTGPSCPNAPLFSAVSDFSLLPFPFPAAGQVPPAVPIGGGAIVARSDRNQVNRLTNSRATWRGAVEYDLGARSLLYASVETGFRSGGFSSARGFETYNPENITAFTLGSKNRLLDNRLQLNVEAFYWKYRDQQVNFVGLDTAGSTANQTRNIGRSTIKGIEAQGEFLATRTTLLSANVQYLDTKNKDFIYQAPSTPTPPVTGCPLRPVSATLVNVDCSGLPAYNSPKWTINLAAQQTVELGDYKLILAADTQYRSKRYIAFGYTPEELAPSVWQSNAQITLAAPGDRWSLSGFVQNIEDKRTPTFQTVSPITNFLVANTTAPRTYGVRASINF